MTEIILLGLALYAAHAIGLRQGRSNGQRDAAKLVVFMGSALISAQEEAAQCRFACQLFEAVLEKQKEDAHHGADTAIVEPTTGVLYWLEGTE